VQEQENVALGDSKEKASREQKKPLYSRRSLEPESTNLPSTAVLSKLVQEEILTDP
jgi:hypothetical protein